MKTAGWREKKGFKNISQALVGCFAFGPVQSSCLSGSDRVEAGEAKQGGGGRVDRAGAIGGGGPPGGIMG